ncbi:hypothetical protein ABT247_25305 [Kitasatospora sp. NPDC001539]|uniref:hypothetical protein n=1 Tax=unclassified Kitasatospora TaxID=2633591 RepID=UPI0033321572
MLLSCRKFACTAAAALAVACGVLAGSAHAAAGSAPAAGATVSVPGAVHHFAGSLSSQIRESQLLMLTGAAAPADWRWG